MRSPLFDINQLRRKLRAAMDDRGQLSALHTEVTDLINHKDAYGEEKQVLVKFREEIRDALKCKLF